MHEPSAAAMAVASLIYDEFHELRKRRSFHCSTSIIRIHENAVRCAKEVMKAE